MLAIRPLPPPAPFPNQEARGVVSPYIHVCTTLTDIIDRVAYDSLAVAGRCDGSSSRGLTNSAKNNARFVACCDIDHVINIISVSLFKESLAVLKSQGRSYYSYSLTGVNLVSFTAVVGFVLSFLLRRQLCLCLLQLSLLAMVIICCLCAISPSWSR